MCMREQMGKKLSYKEVLYRPLQKHKSTSIFLLFWHKVCGKSIFPGHWSFNYYFNVLYCRIVKVNDFLSFAGLHLFLQTQLPIQEINGFLEGKYGEHASVEELITSQELGDSNEEDKLCHVCLSEDCTLLNSCNWDITSADNISTHSESSELGSEKFLSDSYSSSLGYLSSSAENSSFMYTMYR